MILLEFRTGIDWTVWVLESAIFFYFVLYLTASVVLIFLSAAYCRKCKRTNRTPPIDFDALEGLGNLVPPVTLVVPAYNEERVIVQSVHSLLSLTYKRLEVVVVNDGSRDGTLDELIRSFSLRKSEVRPSGELPTKPIRGFYVSRIDPRVVVVDKENGGKSDSMNAGINFSQNPYFMAMDGDTLFEPEALTNALRLILEDRERVVAVGGVVRGINGSIVDAGRIRRPQLLLNFWVIIQVIEYLRSFLAGRTGWSLVNGLLVVPGAFGLFQKAACVMVGGFGTKTVTEDLELTLKLHRFAREKGLDWRILLAPDAVCWTEMPSNYKSLSGQRKRWHEGLLQTIRLNKTLLFNPRYAVVGLVSLPHLVLYEAGGPFIELLGLVLLPALYFMGWLNQTAFILYLLLAFFVGAFFSLIAIFLDQTYFPRYTFPRDALLLLAFSLIENFGYRQLYLIWRLQATWNVLFGKVVWRVSERTGFATRIGK
jgi:cellulose synthase/poly-beta-1,6-N-acetylglucosamine synthase-like glycosyltransferase